MKKQLLIVLMAVLCMALLCVSCQSEPAHTEATAEPTEAPTEAPVEPTEAPEEPVDENATVVVNLGDYFAQDVWENDGGDVSVDENGITFDNGYMGDFAAIRLKKEFKNVEYNFSIQLKEIPEDLSVEDGTFWDAELLILLRSALPAVGWEDGQTGYSITSWGDMSEAFIGRAGHDDAFGSFKWNLNDGEVHNVSFSAINNEDDSTVALKIVIDGETVFEVVDDASITKEDRISLFPNAGGLTMRCKYLAAAIGK